MNAREIHAVIAAGAGDPLLIEKWKRNPEILCASGIGDLDLRALEYFAGLALKVRHNGIRSDLPLTFRLLSATCLEAELFSAYAVDCASSGRALASTSLQRATELITFLENWLDFSSKNQLLLWDIARHEHALSILRRLASPLLKHLDSTVATDGTSIPVINGVVIQHLMQSRPDDLTETLRQGSPLVEDVPLSETYCCYWRPAGSVDIHLLLLDELAFYTIASSNGKNSVIDICNQLFGNVEPLSQFLSALKEISRVGVLRFTNSRNSSS